MTSEVVAGPGPTGVAGVADKIIGAMGPDRSLTERVALFAAAASVGPSFQPGLQPRKTLDQAIATGVIAATTLSAVTATQSAIETLGRIITGRRTDTASAAARLAFTVGTNVVVAAVGEGLSRALPPREDEPFRRGLAHPIAHQRKLPRTTAFRQLVAGGDLPPPALKDSRGVRTAGSTSGSGTKRQDGHTYLRRMKCRTRAGTELVGEVA